MEIVLARHGQPDLPPWPWIGACRMKDWIADYDAAWIVAAPAHCIANRPQNTARRQAGTPLVTLLSAHRPLLVAAAIGRVLDQLRIVRHALALHIHHHAGQPVLHVDVAGAGAGQGPLLAGAAP